MLESLVASVLNRVLGSYVENFDRKQLQIGLLSGDVKLHGLQLKSGALDQLNLPINVVSGHIGSLVLQIPYSNLKSKPVKVLIEDVFLIAKPDLDFEADGQKRRDHTAKLEKLALWELTSDRALAHRQDASEESVAEAVKQQNFTSSLVTKIVENLQITIRNIHVRFEDMEVGIAVGATLGELSALSTNANWEPAFIANVEARTHKLVTLDSLAFYIDPDVTTEFCAASENSQNINSEEQRERQNKLLAEFKAMIFDSIGATDILRPINGQGFITMSKEPANENEPKVRADLKFEELSINLDREQYVDVLKLTQRFQKHFDSIKFRKNRPQVSVKEDPLAWFRYAAKTVLQNVRERNRVWTWDAIKKRLTDQKDYVRLYKKWYQSGGSEQSFDGPEKEQFEELQQKYNYSDLVFFRSLAKQDLLKEYGDLAKARQSNQQQQQQQTWSQWLWGSKPAQTQTSDGSKPPIQITDKDRLELLDVLDEPNFGQDAANQKLLELDFSLRSAGVRLKNGEMALASAGFEGVTASFINKPSSFSYEMRLKKFAVSDLTHKNKFSELITIQHLHDDDEGVLEDFLWLFFEHHPADKVADSNLFLKSQSLVMVHNARLVESVSQFFEVPPDQGETVDAILLAANKTVEELREQTRLGLEYALENHKTLNLQLDIKAPTIVIPLDANDANSAALVLDVGSLGMASDLVPLNVLQEVKSKQALQYTQADWKRLESLMYDRFTIKLQDTQILLGDSISDIEKYRKDDTSRCHFLDKTTLEFLLEISIVPYNTSLTRSRLSITLPSLRATLSDAQYLLFLKIVASATPREEYPPETDSISSSDSEPIADNNGDNDLSLVIGDTKQSEAQKSLSLKQKLANQPQRIFELLFVVKEVHFFVVKGWKGKPLVDMCLHEFNVKFWTTNNLPSESMGVDVTIRDLLINDHVDNTSSPELRKIAESIGHAENSTSAYNLFKVQYRKSSTGDMTINMDLDAVKFTLNPTSVLEVYDYVMSTFTQPCSETSLDKSKTINSRAEYKDIDSAIEDKIEKVEAENEDDRKIEFTLNMCGISAILVEDHQSIATVAMEKTTINVLLQKDMKVQVILGSVSVKDRSDNSVLSIEKGNDLADFRYETQPLDSEMKPTGPSLVYLRMGKARLSVLEGPLTQIMSFLTRLTAMKSAYDQARMMAFNQAIQVEPGMFLFDVVISSPVIFWPCEDDWISLNVGEFIVHNTFKGAINDLKASIQHAQLTSSIHNVVSEIVPETAFNVHVVHIPDDPNNKSKHKDRPIVSVKSNLSPIHVRSSEHQYKLFMAFLASLSKISEGAVNSGLAEEEVGNLRRQLAKEKHIAEQKAFYWWGENFSLALGAPNASPEQSSARSKLSAVFEAPLFDISLEMDDTPLSRLSIQEVAIDLNANAHNGTEVNFHIRSFAAEDLGNKENKFTQIIPPVKHSGYQVMGRIVQEPNKPLEVDCSIDSPQVIVALGYMLRLKSFAEYGMSRPDSAASDEYYNEDEEPNNHYLSDVESEAMDDYDELARSASGHASQNSLVPSGGGTSTSQISLVSTHNQSVQAEKPKITPRIKVDIVDMYLTVLADESDESSEAIVFKIEQFMFDSNAAPTIEVSKVGMYLTNMKYSEDYQLRILDDFNITCWFDDSESTEKLRLSNARVKIDALVLRISLREICLISNIASKASAIYSSGQTDRYNANTESSAASKAASSKKTNFFADNYRVASPSHSNEMLRYTLTGGSQTDEQFEVTRVLSEQLTIELDGFRVVLIDPVHQLPVTDFVVKPFTIEAKNWSDSLVAEAKAELYANVNSFTKSAWEPLIDTMELGLTVTSDSVTVYSDATANLELTTETLELWKNIQDYFSSANEDNVLVSHRDDAAPYRVRNETGMEITIWNESRKLDHKQTRKLIKNGEEVKWAFHNWRELRENLNVIEHDYYIGIEFEDNYYDPLQNVAVNRIGEHISVLKHDGDKERLVVDIWVDNHLKYVVIRSPYTIHNHTDTTLEIKPVMNNVIALPTYQSDQFQDEIIEILPNTAKSLPLKKVDSRVLVRRKGDSEWCEQGIYWKDMISQDGNTSKTIRCENNFLLQAIPERPDIPVSKVYPYLAVHLSAPFQIINNLPRDVVLRLYCRSTREESHFSLEKAGRAHIHNYSDESLLLLRVDIEGYKCNKFAVINTGKKYSYEFHIEDTIEVSQNNQFLRLHLEYVDLPEGNGRVIVIYSPYIIVNNTEKDLVVSSHTNRLLCPANSASLWSFAREKSHGSEKVAISCHDSHMSHPVHIEATGTSAEVKVLSRDRQRELYFGVSISSGSGRYVNTKIVTFSSRFIIYNTLDRPMAFRELGGNEEMLVGAGKQESVGYIFGNSRKEMCMKFADSDNAQWSSSFVMSNVGAISVRAAEKGKPTILIKVEVILEKSTLFIHLSPAKGWPYSIRNFTDQEYIFYQSDPYADEDGEDTGEYGEFTPITYRLPPRSAMPYSWDFPAAAVKQIVLELSAPVKPERPPQLPQRPPQLPSRDNQSSRAASILSRTVTAASQDPRQSAGAEVSSRMSTSAHRRAPRSIKYRKIQLAEIGELPPANFGDGSLVDLSVIADGPQLALVISPYNAETSHYDPETNKVRDEFISDMEEIDNKTGRTYHVNLRGIGISCITPESQELFYVTLHNIKVSYGISDAMESISTEVQWIQVDNSLPGASDFPVIIYPTVLPKAAEELAAHPCFSASLTRMRDDSFGVTYIKHATLLLQEMSIEVDEDFLLGLVKLVISISHKTGPVGSKNRTYIPLLDDDTVLCEHDLDAPRPSQDSAPDIYFEQLHLQPIQLNLSFVRTGSLSTTDVFKDNTAAGSLAFIIDALTLTIGNVNVAPLRFNALLVDNVRTHLSNLISMIQVHYQQEFMYQLHKVLGSADIIGNPVGLFNNISSGVMDLFYEPYMGYTLQDRPSEFGVGLAKGGLSFMKKSVFGISDSISKVTGSISKGLTAMTLDNRYQKQQRARRSRNRPKHLVYGLRYGLESFYESFSSGMMGLAEQPMQGALTDGTAGFFKGLGVGLLGLPTKTSIGLLDFASNVTEGIRNTTTVFDVHAVNRVRLPRVIAADGVIRPYNARESVGQMLLHSVNDGRYAHDHYLAHCNLTKNKVVIVSVERVMVVSINESTLEWSLSYSQIESIAVEQSGIVITLRGGAHGPFIPLPDPNSRKYIYEHIGKGVTQFQHRRIEFN